MIAAGPSVAETEANAKAAPEGQNPRGGDVETTGCPVGQGKGGLVPFLALALVFIAAFIHASWNLMSKRAASAGPASVFAYNLVACVAYTPWVAWLIAHGAVNCSGSGWPAS